MMNLEIDGLALEAREGESVLQVALRNGIDIPHLCAHPALPPYGACRLCIVEIEGMRGYPASCSTPATEGMRVWSSTAGVRSLRRQILELILLEHPSACLVCDKSELCERYRPKAQKSGRTSGCQTCNNKEVCEVRSLADRLDLKELPLPPQYRQLPLERSAPFIDRDLNLCILCGRCIRICKVHQGQAVIDFVDRGGRMRVGQAFGRSLIDSGCTFCGSCVDICPTGSISDRYAKWHGHYDATVETTCGFCGEACPMRVYSRGGRAGHASAVDASQPICALGRFAAGPFVNGSQRLTQPKVRRGNFQRPVAWDESLREAGERLKEYKGGAFALVCDTSSPVEARRLFRRFVTDVMQSPHFIELTPDKTGFAETRLPEGVKAAIVTGAFLKDEVLDGLDLLIVQGAYPSKMAERADVLLPAALGVEAEGSIEDSAGVLRPLRRGARPPGEARQDWEIICGLARAMEAEGFGFETPGDVAVEFGLPEAAFRRMDCAPGPARDLSLLRAYYRGHGIGEVVGGLKHLKNGDGKAEVLSEVDIGTR